METILSLILGQVNENSKVHITLVYFQEMKIFTCSHELARNYALACKNFQVKRHRQSIPRLLWKVNLRNTAQQSRDTAERRVSIYLSVSSEFQIANLNSLVLVKWKWKDARLPSKDEFSVITSKWSIEISNNRNII